MIWLALRQRRGTIIALAIGLAVVALFLVVSGRSMFASFDDDGLAACLDGVDGGTMVPFDGGCIDRADAFSSRFFSMRLLGLVAFTIAPLALGMFLGAPVVARELEQDTVSLAWTQGITRRRWTWSHLLVVGAITVVSAGALGAFVSWWYGPLNAATGDRFQWLIYDQQGLVPIGYAVFAMALAAFLGAVTGRTLRAMAIAAIGFLVIRFGVAVWVRPKLASPLERTYPVLGDLIPNRLLGDWLYGGGGPGVGVVLRANGERIAGGQRICPPPDTECLAEVGKGAYNLELFHPASRFWTFQAIETAIFLVLALALFATTVWWVRRRLR